MSTYDDLKKSTALSRPVELYEFNAGPQVFRYTSSSDPITNLSQVYKPVVAPRDNLVFGVDDRSRVIEISIPADDPFAQLYIPKSPSYSVMGKIIEIQRDESPSPVQYVKYIGFVRGVQFTNNLRVAKVGLISAEGSRSDTFPRDTFSPLCNAQVYDTRCRSNPDAHTFIGPCTAKGITSIGSTITVTGAGSSGHKFKGGFASILGTNDLRLVLVQGNDLGLGSTSDVVVLLTDFNDDPVGKSIKLVAGCDKKMNGDCALVHDNVINFKGFQYVPRRSLFELGLD